MHGGHEILEGDKLDGWLGGGEGKKFRAEGGGEGGGEDVAGSGAELVGLRKLPFQWCSLAYFGITTYQTLVPSHFSSQQTHPAQSDFLERV